MKLMSLSIIIVSCYLVSCTQPNKTSAAKKQQAKIDTANSIKIGSYWATPTKLLDKYDATILGDTLNLVTCNNYVYCPFGKSEKKADFKNTLLRKFYVTDKKLSTDSRAVNLNILTYKASKLAFFLEDDDTAMHSTIAKGEIYDSEVELLEGIKVGMSEDDFNKKFFAYFPSQLKGKYSVISLNACIDGIVHIYSFKSNRLNSIKFTNSYIFKVEY